ncbi:hypothetical protein EW146_g9364 [Bondarzewia mesenterica]|uniref:Major facilitator superfamily (MFS) profile domain-containing protein n=1 Tax=Bondarzewia mesenterica TaxID=1095465 RepID=A0A4S4L6X1_9AGAM|nr:hypothetical protein EW146_g9364 [Bondarzewia mesenterica]
MLSPITSSMIAPAANRVAHDLGATSPEFQPLLTSIFVLAYAFGPLLFGPLSQIFGRSRVVQIGNLFYLLFNIVCGFAKTPGQMLAFRFLTGLGGSAPLAIGGGVIYDCWTVETRGQAVTLYALAPLLGPIIGPIAGAWIASTTTWKWVFWSTSIADAVIQVVATIWLEETFAPVLLARKARRVRKELPDTDKRRVITTFQQGDDNKPSILKQLMYPVRILLMEPIAQLLGIYLAYIYGLVYLLLTSIPNIYVAVYHESIGIAGLHYLSFGIGMYVGSQLSNLVLDRIRRILTTRNNNKGRPEFRLRWTANAKFPWIAPDIGLLLTGVGIAVNYQAIQTYIIDTYTVRAAPALGGLSLLRSLVGFALPLCSPAMYKHLGYGTGNTILAACALGLGCPTLLLLWFFGRNLRNRSATAMHD